MQRRIFLVVAIDVLMMAVVGIMIFYGGSSQLPEEDVLKIVVLAMILPMVTSAILILLLFLPAWRMNKLKKTGMQAWAEVLEEPGQSFISSVKISGVGGYTNAAVRVQRSDMLPYEATMQAQLMAAPYLKPGMRVLVRCDPNRPKIVVLDDAVKDIIERNETF